MKRSYLLIGTVTLFLAFMVWIWNMPDSYVVENENFIQEEVKTTTSNSNERNINVVNTKNEEIEKTIEENLTDKDEDSNSVKKTCIAITYTTFLGEEKSGFIKEVELEEITWNDLTFYTFIVLEEMDVYEDKTLENIIGTVYKNGWLWNINKITMDDVIYHKNTNAIKDSEPIDLETSFTIKENAEENEWKINSNILNPYKKEEIFDVRQINTKRVAYNNGRIRSCILSNSSSTLVVSSNVSIVNGVVIEDYKVVSFKSTEGTMSNTFNNIAIKKESQSKKMYIPIVDIAYI